MTADVDAWFETRQHPQLDLMQAVRSVILGADPRIAESVKWQTPTFAYKGNIVSINPQAKAYVSLLFHKGATISGSHPILEGGGDVARYARIDSVADLAARGQELEAVVRAWCDDRDRER
jgi:hypothetical protein